MLSRRVLAVALVLAGVGGLVLLTAVDVEGAGFFVLAFAVQGLLAGWLTRAWWSALLPPATALIWAPIGDALGAPASDIPFWLVLLVVQACALAGVVAAVLGAFVARERALGGTMPPGAAMLLAVAACALSAGCGGRSGAVDEQVASGATSAPASAPAPLPRSAARHRVASGAGRRSESRRQAPSPLDAARARMPGGPRPAARTLPDGAVVVPPPAPTSTEASASRECAQATVDHGGVRTTLEVPPAPGLRARVVDDVIRVTVDTGRPSPSCVPQYVSIAAERAAELHAPIVRIVRLRGPGVQTVDLPLDGASASSIRAVRATAGTYAGRISPTVHVLLSP